MYSQSNAASDLHVLKYLESISSTGVVGNNAAYANAPCNTAPSSCSEFALLNLENPTTWANNQSILQAALKNQNDIILFNSQDPKSLSDMLGIGFNSSWAIIQPHDDYTVITLADESSKSSERIIPPAMPCCCCCCNMSSHLMNAVPSSPARSNPSAVQSASNAITELPASQYRHFYVVLPQKIELTPTQTGYAEIVLDISLIASFNPNIKYLHIRSVGAGCHPAQSGSITWDDPCKRGYFQNKIHLSLLPDSDSLTILSNNPQNVNNNTSYTASSTFQVGTNVSEYPGYKLSYEVNNTKTTTISDFTIKNETSGRKASWDFLLSLMYPDLYNIFSADWHDGLKSLPILAVSNLQPITDTVWFAPQPFNSTVKLTVEFYVDYYAAWDYRESHRQFDKKTCSTTREILLDFSQIKS